MGKKLTAMQLRFVEEYLIDTNATRAGERAGFAKSTSGKVCPMWVGRNRDSCPDKFKHVWDAVSYAKQARSKATQIDAEFVLTRLGELVNADPAEIINPVTGAYMPLHDWPIEWRRMLSAADVQEIINSDGVKIGEIVKFKFIDRLRAYEMLGKHVDVKAFVERKEITGKNGGAIQVESINTNMTASEAAKIYRQEVLGDD